MAVTTNAVRNRLIGEARKALQEAAGANQLVSRTESRKLPPDVSAAVESVRANSTRVSVDDAVDAYARKVSRTLAAVDTRGKGTLSAAEANRISDPNLRARVIDVRTALLQGDGGPTGNTDAISKRLKELTAGVTYPTGGGVEAGLNTFRSGSTTRQPLTAEVVRDLLAPQWATLIDGVAGGNSNLADMQPGLANLDDLAAYRLPRAETREFLTQLTTDLPDQFGPIVDYMRDKLTDLTVVDFAEKDASGNAYDVGYIGRFVGGRTSDGHLTGFFTSLFSE